MPSLYPLGQETIVVENAPLVTGRTGALIRDWDNAAQTVISECMIQPFILADKLNYTNDGEREFTKNSFRVFAPPGTASIVQPESRILWRGVTYEVQGIPGKWFDFDSTEVYVAFLIRDRRG